MQHSEPLRLFIGVKPEANVSKQLSALVASMQGMSFASRLRWLKPVNIHLTLRFLGKTEPDRIDRLVSRLEKRPAFSPVSYQLHAVSGFPDCKNPVVIAALVAENKPLQALVDELESVAINCGFAAEEKPFRGHISLARCRRGFDQANILPQQIEPINGLIKQITVYRSDTGPEGAEYTALTCINSAAN